MPITELIVLTPYHDHSACSSAFYVPSVQIPSRVWDTVRTRQKQASVHGTWQLNKGAYARISHTTPPFDDPSIMQPCCWRFV